jgi:hypothetical protein
MDAMNVDESLEQLMRRWHYTVEYATAAWAEYQALREALPASDRRVAMVHASWRAAEKERRTLLRAIERLEAEVA